MEIFRLNRTEEHDNYAARFGASDGIILVFPLYTDAMPGIVMAFIEKLSPWIGRMKGKRLGFIIHSGFPEPAHSRYIQRYLEWLCSKFQAEYAGTCVMGGSEGLRYMNEGSMDNKRLLFNRLGHDFISRGRFSPDTLKRIAGKEKLPVAMRFWFRLTGFSNAYWDMLLKKNHAYDTRFARPYSVE